VSLVAEEIVGCIRRRQAKSCGLQRLLAGPHVLTRTPRTPSFFPAECR
jgi:hypothetical protein